MSILMRAAKLKTLARITAAHLLVCLTLGTPALAQTTAQAPTATAPAQDTVTVKGARKTVDQREVVAAKSRILSQKTAASCNFMAGYDSNQNDVVLDYMSDANMEGSASNPNSTTNLRDTSPQGNSADRAGTSFTSSTDAGADSSSAGLTPSDTRENCSSADRNFAAARNQIARTDTKLRDAYIAYEAGDFTKATSLFKQAYDKVGYEEAAYMVGQIYLLGEGVETDSAQAVIWLRKVAEQRYDATNPKDFQPFDPQNPEYLTIRGKAVMMLAKIYLVGWGLPKNPAESRKWYTKGDEIGLIPATYALGVAYQTGFGGEKNIKKAMTYFKRAGEVGYASAQFQMGMIYYNGDDGVEADMKLAGAWFLAAAKNGNPAALFAVGRMYDLGEGVAADSTRALVYYKDAALKGNADAENALATYFYSGEGVPQDFATARKLFEAAAKQGQVDAMFNLAVMMVGGQGGDKDLAMAYIWFSLAKAVGHEKADAALKALEPKLSDADISKIQSILNPKAATTAKP